MHSLTIPASVTSIGDSAFKLDGSNITNLTILNGVASIGSHAFQGWSQLPSLTLPPSVTNLGISAFNACSSLTNVTLGSGLTSLPNSVFFNCTSLGQVTIPSGITNIGNAAFENCSSLSRVYFPGNAPDAGTNTSVFSGTAPGAVAYNLPGTTGWGATYDGLPTVLWNPHPTSYTATGGQFGFNLNGPTNATVIVMASTNLANPVWQPVSTLLLSGSGNASFSDPQSTNYAGRFYRFRSP